MTASNGQACFWVATNQIETIPSTRNSILCRIGRHSSNGRPCMGILSVEKARTILTGYTGVGHMSDDQARRCQHWHSEQLLRDDGVEHAFLEQATWFGHYPKRLTTSPVTQLTSMARRPASSTNQALHLKCYVFATS